MTTKTKQQVNALNKRFGKKASAPETREWDESVMSRAIKAIMDQEIINRQNKGKEFYRHDYDLALHIWTAIKGAGLKIVKERSK